MVPPNMARTRGISVIRLTVPECPPPPAPMQFSPSTPASMPFSAKRTLVASWKTTPPQSWTTLTSSAGLPIALTMIFTPCRRHASRFALSSSAGTRPERLTATGPTRAAGCWSEYALSASRTDRSQWSNSSSERAFCLARPPMMPARAASRASAGPLTWYIGAQTAGRRSADRISGSNDTRPSCLAAQGLTVDLGQVTQQLPHMVDPGPVGSRSADATGRRPSR